MDHHKKDHSADAAIRKMKIEEDIRKMKNDFEKCDDDVNKQIERIRAKRANFVSKILETEEALIEKLQNKISKSLTTDEKKDIEELASFFNAHVHTAYDNVVMEMLDEYQGLQRRWTTVTSRARVKFVEGKVLPDTISYMFGDVVEEETPARDTVTNVASVTHGEDQIMSISPTSDTEVWTYSYNTKQIDHINTKGEVITKRNLTSYCGTFIVIRSISSSDVIHDVMSIAPLYPNGINRSRDGGMLVCLSDCTVDKITPDSRGEVLHVDMAGNLLRRYDYQNDNTKLFTRPWRVAQNVNLDICVVDIIDNTWKGVLVVMSVEGKVKCTYKGQPSCKEVFIPDGVCFDTQGRILLTDYMNNAVHLLSPEGAFLQFLLTEQSTLRDPTSIALHNNTLLVGCYDGKVKVYKYSN